jgi:hypothetical protein
MQQEPISNIVVSLRTSITKEYSEGFMQGAADYNRSINMGHIYMYGRQKAEDNIYADFTVEEAELNYLDGYYEAIVSGLKADNANEELEKVNSEYMDGLISKEATI